MSDTARHEPTPKTFAPTGTIILLLVVTLGYVGVLVWLFAHLDVCADDGGNSGLLSRYLGCRSVNELGDALAGAFAPLAFLWLAGAVFIQSRELAAQRKELELARDEARQTREVLAQQRDESRAATQFIGKQTAILEREQDLREQEQSDEEFDAVMNTLESAVSLMPLYVRVNLLNPSPEVLQWGQSEEHWSMTPRKPIGANPEGAFYEMLDSIREGIANLSGLKAGRYELLEWDATNFRVFQGRLDALLRIADRLSAPYKAKVATFRLEELASEMRRFTQLCGQQAVAKALLKED